MAIQSAEGVARDIDKMYSLGLDPYNLRLLAACIAARDAAIRAEERDQEREDITCYLEIAGLSEAAVAMRKMEPIGPATARRP